MAAERAATAAWPVGWVELASARRPTAGSRRGSSRGFRRIGGSGHGQGPSGRAAVVGRLHRGEKRRSVAFLRSEAAARRSAMPMPPAWPSPAIAGEHGPPDVAGSAPAEGGGALRHGRLTKVERPSPERGRASAALSSAVFTFAGAALATARRGGSGDVVEGRAKSSPVPAAMRTSRFVARPARGSAARTTSRRCPKAARWTCSAVSGQRVGGDLPMEVHIRSYGSLCRACGRRCRGSPKLRFQSSSACSRRSGHALGAAEPERLAKSRSVWAACSRLTRSASRRGRRAPGHGSTKSLGGSLPFSARRGALVGLQLRLRLGDRAASTGVAVELLWTAGSTPSCRAPAQLSHPPPAIQPAKATSARGSA